MLKFSYFIEYECFEQSNGKKLVIFMQAVVYWLIFIDISRGRERGCSNKILCVFKSFHNSFFSSYV